QLEADNSVAQRLEAFHVEGDVVVGAENVAGSAAVSVLDVGQDTVDWEQAERGAVHLADAAKVTEVQAATRGFDDVGLPEIHVKARCQPLVARGQTDFRQVGEGPARVVDVLIPFPIGQARHLVQVLAAVFNTIEQFPEGEVAGLCTSSALIVISPRQRRDRGQIAAWAEGQMTSTSRCGHLGQRTTRGKIPHQATFRAPTALYQTDGPRSRRRASSGEAVRAPQPCVYPCLLRPGDPVAGRPPARSSNRAPRSLI